MIVIRNSPPSFLRDNITEKQKQYAYHTTAVRHNYIHVHIPSIHPSHSLLAHPSLAVALRTRCMHLQLFDIIPALPPFQPATARFPSFLIRIELTMHLCGILSQDLTTNTDAMAAVGLEPFIQCFINLWEIYCYLYPDR